MQLFSYWRSLATYRVRMALNLKGLTPEVIEIDLHAGNQLKPEFAAINPMKAIPVLVDGGTSLHQSLPIMEYLEEKYPGASLMPADAFGRARVRALAQMTVADTHPLIVPRVRADLASRFGATPQQVNAWAQHWLKTGLEAYETVLTRDRETGQFCHGDRITIADICLCSHAVGSRLFEVSLDAYPKVREIVERCNTDPRVAAAHPLKQPGAPRM